jgi:hypothetical protein
MSNTTTIEELRGSFLRQTQNRLMAYAESHTGDGLKQRLVNLANIGELDDDLVAKICAGRPEMENSWEDAR